MQELVSEFFSKAAHSLSNSLTTVLSRKIAFESLQALPLERAEMFKRIASRGAVFSAYLAPPLNSMLIQFFPEDIGRLLPELAINPDAAAPPPAFTDLHRSALQEMMGGVWGAAAPELAAALGLQFKIGRIDAAWDTMAGYVSRQPALKDVMKFTAGFFRIRIAGGLAQGVTAIVVPTELLERGWKKASQPPPRPPLSKDVKLEALQVRKVDSKTIVKKSPAAGGKTAAPAKSRPSHPENMSALLDIPVELVVELGDTRMPIQQILGIAHGTVIELKSRVNQPIELKTGGVVIARGEVVAVDDSFGIRITDLVGSEERMKE